MFITPSFKKSLIVEQFQGNYLKGGRTFQKDARKTDILRYACAMMIHQNFCEMIA